MSVRIFEETRLSLSAAASRIGVHVGTLHRWRLRGVRGVRLETIVIGGLRYTSAEALERFVAATTAAADGTPAPAIRTSRQRETAIAAAERELASA
jgi:uncharacterized protein DUF1580